MLQHPDKKMTTWLRLYLTAGYVAALVIPVMLYYILDIWGAATVFIILTVVFIMLFFIVLPQYREHCTFNTRSDCLVVTKGYFFPRTYILPQRNIQYISITECLSEKILGICTVNVATGSWGVKIFALKKNTARNLRLLYEKGGET